jgi:hypothetical protein
LPAELVWQRRENIFQNKNKKAYLFPICCNLIFCDIFQNHVDVDIETSAGTNTRIEKAARRLREIEKNDQNKIVTTLKCR